jgi:hypothetical protein
MLRVVDPDVDDGSDDVVGEPTYFTRPLTKEPPASAPRRPAPRRRIALVLGVALIVAAAIVTVLPYYALQSATRDSDACFTTIAQTGTGDPARCVPASWALSLGERVPWFRANVIALRAKALGTAATLAYSLATAATPDRAARAAAAERIHELAGQPLAAALPMPGHEALAGAFDALTVFGTASDDKQLRRLAFGAARAAGDPKALRSLALGGDASDAALLNLERGAALCLTGARAEGQRTLGAADASRRARRPGEHGFDAARLALFACGADGAIAVDARNVTASAIPALVALEAHRGTVSGLDRARTLLLEADAKPALTALERLRLAARVVAHDRPTLVVTLATLVPLRGATAAVAPAPYRTPWTLLDADASPVDEDGPRPSVLAAPDAQVATADYLETKLSTVDHDEALECDGDECPAARALERPAEVARELIFALRLDAAAEFARRGQTELAAAQAHAAYERAPLSMRELVAPVFLLVGEAEAALAAYRDGGKTPRALIGAALALGSLGRFDDARQVADEAAENLRRKPTDDADIVAVAWLQAAMALSSDGAVTLVEQLEGSDDRELALVAEWLSSSLNSEERRRPLREGMRLTRPPIAVLPAVVHVAVHVLPHNVDASVWLDRVFDDVHRATPTTAWLARAEAAKWRGDQTAAEQAQERGDRLRRLVTDDAQSLLALFARLR